MDMKEERLFKVTLEIKAPDKEYIEDMLENMPHSDRIFQDKIIDPNEERLECRIRYDKDWGGEGEHFVFENKWTNEDEWGLDSAFPLVAYENGELVRGKGDLINYHALTKIRELIHLGVDYYFGE